MSRRIGIIGVGEIASAIVEGLGSPTDTDRTDPATTEAVPAVTETPRPRAIVLSPRSSDRAARLAQRYDTVEVAGDNQEVVDRSDLIFLSVLPGQVEAVLGELDIPADRTLVSAVAGVSVAALAALLHHHPSIVRVIPLPAVRERRGVTAIFPSDPIIEQLFDRLGGTVVAETEAMFSTLSATTATMSAHFAYLEVLTRWLIDEGWDRADAEAIIRGQFVGLGTTLAQTDTPIAELVAAHETPGGLNAQLRAEWMDAGNEQRLATALTNVLARVSSTPKSRSDQGDRG